MNILFLGDVVGKAGCQAVMRHLRSLKKLYAIDACIINGENSAEGNGITPESAQMLFDAGADVITTGNHVLKRREIYPLLEEEKGIIRPANYHPSVPGSGMFVLDCLRWQLCVINLQGHNSIWSAALMHGVWNLVMVGGLLHIGTVADSDVWVQYLLDSDSLLLTGGDFGIEASIVSIVVYLAFACLSLSRCRRKGLLEVRGCKVFERKEKRN